MMLGISTKLLCIDPWDGGGGLVLLMGSPSGVFWGVLPNRRIPKPYQHRKDIIQQESLSTDVLQYSN